VAVKKPVTANPARTCTRCGWTAYPQPVMRDERAMVVEWRVEPRCPRCRVARSRVKG
jgi:hypothetical protein